MTGQSGSKIHAHLRDLEELQADTKKRIEQITHAWNTENVVRLVQLGVLDAQDAERERANTELAEAL